MMAVLLGAGVGLLLAGFAAIVYGIPVKEFSFGNTMILSGVVAACSGLIMLALWVMTRELQNVARRLSGGISVAPQMRAALQPSLAPSAPRGAGDAGDFVFSRDQQPGEISGGAELPPWPAEGAAPEMPLAPPPAEPAPPKPKRNLMFSSSSRKERERAASRTSEPLAPDLLSPDLRPPPSASPPPAPEMAEPPPATFEDAWPKPDRGRPGEAPPPRRGRTPPADANGAPREAAPQVTVLKSGVVDGMAYSLYSDGSIEAQMPEGMMRFASIDELRAHLDQRP